MDKVHQEPEKRRRQQRKKLLKLLKFLLSAVTTAFINALVGYLLSK